MENWKDIEGYEGLYQISNEGSGKSLERIVESSNKWGKYMSHRKERILRPYTDVNGYMSIKLCKNGEKEREMVHVLVAKAFLPNPHNKPYVHHIDFNNQNNRVENLMWVTREEHDAIHHDQVAKFVAERDSKTVCQYTKDGLLVNVWKSAAEAAKTLGFSQGHICDCCNGKRKTHKGYRWSYEPL